MESANNGIAEALKPFHCLRLRVEVRATRNILLPPYLGSAVRGAFGMALRQTCCVLRHQECPTCLLRSRCVYSYTFETSLDEENGKLRRYTAAPHPFVLNLDTHPLGVQETGSVFSFGVTLIGRATDFLPYFVYTFQRMGELGLGKGRGTFEVLRVLALDGRGADAEEVYAHGDLHLPSKPLGVDEALAGLGTADGKPGPCEPAQTGVPGEPAAGAMVRSPQSGDAGDEAGSNDPDLSELAVTFDTPARFDQRGELRREPRFDLLAGSLLRRLENLVRFHCGGEGDWVYGSLLEEAARVELVRNETRWHDWERYSNRQDRRMKLGGFVGRALYRGRLTPFLPLLALGTWVNVGKGTTFGLGRYRVVRSGEDS
jgi:hypothetical protein